MSDSVPASKRRKLDSSTNENHKSSPAPSTKTYAGRQTQSSPAVHATKATTTAADLWRDAKSRVDTKYYKAKRSKEEVDLYDDIEGANKGRRLYEQRQKGKNALPENLRGEARAEPPHRTATNRAAAENGGVLKRKAVDPLRNQRDEMSAKNSKPRSNGMVGFFKKFTQPALLAEEQDTAANGEKREGKEAKEKAVNGASKMQSQGGVASLSGVPESQVGRGDDARKAQIPCDVEAQRQKGAGAWRSYVYGKPKKTFEDEIREVAENARKQAEAEGSEDELASHGEMPRSSNRRHTRRPETTSPAIKPRQEPARVSSKRPRKPLDRRKMPETDIGSLKPDLDVVEAHSEEIEDSEPDLVQVAQAGALPPRRSPAAIAAVTKERKTTKARQVQHESKPPLESMQLQCIQRVLLEKTTGKRAIPLTNVEDEYAKVRSVVVQTITAGESNSMLLIGARGSGKSTLVNSILNEQHEKHADDFHVIRLNGFIHTDDKIALREIWRQLGREMDSNEEEAGSKNYADTMSKLLALLSHTAEMDLEETDQVTKSVIFVLDEFELFATHPRQTLLYNLFDIAQSRKAPIAVLGLTTRIDVAESLEKRVKSRFSHRYVHLGLSKSLQAFEHTCRSALTLTTEELSSEEVQSLAGDSEKVQSLNKGLTERPAILLRWNAIAGETIESDFVATRIKRLYYRTKSIPEFLAPLTLAVATMPVGGNSSDAALEEHLQQAFAHSALRPPDSKLVLLSSLSILQLALLICAARLTNIYNTEIISFALCYEEYKTLASKAKLQASASGALAQGAGSKIWGKEVARTAWEELVECGLVVEDGRAGGTGRVDVGLEEIGMSDVELGQWGRWCKEI